MVPEEPSVYDLTDLLSSSAISDPSSVKTSLLLSDELDAASFSLASVEEVASCNPMPNWLSNRLWSSGGASGGGGLVHFPRLGAICSGGGRRVTGCTT